MQPKEKIIHHDIPLRPWEVFGTDVFHFNNKNYLWLVDYHSEFPIVKRLEGLSAESLITTIKVIFTEYGIPHKLMSDAGMNFVSDKFQKFCNSINVELAVLLAYHHQSNGQVEACIKFIKHAFKKCTNSGGDINMALLQICTTLLGQGLLCLPTLMFKRQVCGIMPVLDRNLLAKIYDDEHHSNLLDRQHKNDNDASPVFASLPIGSAVAVQQEDGRLWTHGTVVNTGDHNHHDWAYTIQLTTNGRWITCNRWHIKPTSVTVETYLQHHTTKHLNTQMDPLEDILKSITNNPRAYDTVHTNRNNIHNTQCHQQTKYTQQAREEEYSQQSRKVVSEDKRQKNIYTPEDKRADPQNS